MPPKGGAHQGKRRHRPPVELDQRALQEIHDDADRFIAQGGRWCPTAALARLIDCAALGIAT